MPSENTLRTLKDMKCYGKSNYGDWLFREKELKAEAIKWIKTFDYERDGMIEAKSILMEFFNLTEENLK